MDRGWQGREFRIISSDCSQRALLAKTFLSKLTAGMTVRSER